jgi:hypothetical protein
MRSDITEFLRAVSNNLFGLLTGGVIAFVVAGVEHWSGRALTPGLYVSIVALGLFVSCFMAWRKQFHARGHLLNIRGEFEENTLILSIRNDGPTDTFSGAITWVGARYTTPRANPYPLPFKWMDKETGDLRIIPNNGTKRVELLRVTTWQNPSTGRQEGKEIHMLSPTEDDVAVKLHCDDGAMKTFISLRFRSLNRDREYTDNLTLFICPTSRTISLNVARELRCEQCRVLDGG